MLTTESCFIFLHPSGNHIQGNETHKDYENLLVETLTKHYKKGGRPVKSNKQPVIVYYDLKVTKLEKLVRYFSFLVLSLLYRSSFRYIDLILAIVIILKDYSKSPHIRTYFFEIQAEIGSKTNFKV